MAIQVSKEHACPRCQGQSVVVVDIETESIPQVDTQGNPRYHCLECQCTFSVDQQGHTHTQEELS